MAAVPVLGTAENPGPQNPESKANTNLIVNYLPQTVTEEELKNLFSAVGTVQSCKLIKDKASGASLGYGFINYSTSSEADKAIQSMNGLPLNSKTIKVSYARPSSTAIKNANLYVANLPQHFTQTELEAMFRPYGTIITSKVLTNPDTGVGKGVGFVRYDKFSEAESAISALNGTQLNGSTTSLLVKFANAPKPTSGNGTPAVQPTAPTKRSSNNNYLANGTVGPMRHVASNFRFTPMGSVPAATSVAAAAAAAVGNTSVVPVTSMQSLTPQTNWCLFVYNLPETCEDSLLYQLFAPFGAISSVNIIRDLASGKCKRYGFVNMINYEEAYLSVVRLNGYMLEGKPLQVSFKSQKLK